MKFRPIAGSMTEMRGQKANIHVCKEMLELCQIIDAEGFTDEDSPDLKIIYFGDLFNVKTIYILNLTKLILNLISLFRNSYIIIYLIKLSDYFYELENINW